ncbi:hypothetical protein HDU67_001081 [Dinochytrium kinnereticum]|nr:hypothetical protein HDU67_001081 [Dinochytrium kinnereticum]
MMSEIFGLAPSAPLRKEKRFINFKASDIEQLQLEIEKVKSEHAKKMALTAPVEQSDDMLMT